MRAPLPRIGSAEPVGSLQALRFAVRDRLEFELLELSARHRPALLRLLDDAGEPLGAEQREVLDLQLDVLENRIRAIRGYLDRAHVPVQEVPAHSDGAVSLDAGEGPRLVLVPDRRPGRLLRA